MIKLNYDDFEPAKHEKNDRHVLRKPHPDFDYEKWWQGWYKEEDQEEEEEEEEVPEMRPATQPRGKILHFIPSEQMKILKDLKASRDVKPIFLRQLAVENEEGHMFPNFDPEDVIKDAR
eukprot:jgi/Hompol1/1800/HPOL_004816-RA